MWRKRTVGIGILFITGLMLLIARLVQIQLVETEHFSKHGVNLVEASVKQRSQEMELDNGRGSFLDKNGQSLTDQTKAVLILFPFLNKMDWNSQKIADIIGTSEYNVKNSIKEAEEPVVYGGKQPLVLTTSQVDEINNLKIPGVFAVEKKFHLNQTIAEQLIGITGQNTDLLRNRYTDKELSNDTLIGLTGLEQSFDEFLLPEGDSKLVYHVDAKGDPLFGLNVKYVEPGNPFYPVNIKTTIDLDLQQRAEELVDQHGIKKGGLVLLNLEDNSIAAMVSRPHISEENPYETNGINNYMLKQQIVGSVFKTVVAAAAMDNNIEGNRTFDCSKKINGEPDTVYQHGMLDFTTSFAVSCNNTFSTLAKELKDINVNLIAEYADKLALTNISGWEGDVFHLENFRQLTGEEEGRIFLKEEEKKDNNYVALTGIGQNEVRVTPLAVANMMSTIAKGGKKESVQAVSQIQYKNGTTLYSFGKKELEGDTLSPYTISRLQELLREVVVNQNGTGRWFQDLPYTVAGKSGTAETGVYVEDKQLHNKWFAGYFPYENPKYALVTVNLDVFSDVGGVNPVFADMVKVTYELNGNS
ncbi:peptidoglycan D,D-transpeptidase FtsI family protein [Bacillus sp. B1-b2]|uniref:peptidoglycan D,D-transpeptidase FtsI family protein n=1 Tax=Bacillus sp. B1-b2 TaxID=2653201 RepID=UPI0012625BF1|nr:penicillin-binding transpeptidase domain-containing protein [Bacillus sp. B1-b2]KAB7667267.1 penicillin-binding protein 2 [Bacillus sp. B1-b2]